MTYDHAIIYCTLHHGGLPSIFQLVSTLYPEGVGQGTLHKNSGVDFFYEPAGLREYADVCRMCKDQTVPLSSPFRAPAEILLKTIATTATTARRYVAFAGHNTANILTHYVTYIYVR